MGTLAKKPGVMACLPNSGLKRSSSGCAVTATQAGIISGRVVEMTKDSGMPCFAFGEGFVDAEFDVVVCTECGSVFDFGLCNGGLEVDVPHGWEFGSVDVSALVEVEE